MMLQPRMKIPRVTAELAWFNRQLKLKGMLQAKAAAKPQCCYANIADGCLNDPEPNMEQAQDACSAICVQSVDAHMSCSSHSDSQLAAFFIDVRAK